MKGSSILIKKVELELKLIPMEINIKDILGMI
jgi:hypothetical protein